MTQLSDLVKYRDAINDFIVKDIFDKAALFQSGLVANAPALVPTTGKLMEMPSWDGLTGDSSVLSDTNPLSATGLSTSNETALINSRGRAFKANDLVRYVSGSQGLVGSVGSQLGMYWAREMNKVAIASVQGALAGADAVDAGSVIVDSSGAAISAEGVVDTLQLFGENADELTIVVMHSAVKSALKKQNLIDTVRPSEGGEFATYHGRMVVVDDNLTDNAGVYTTIFARSGAVGFADGTYGEHIVETDRDALAGNDIIVARRRFALHPAGATFQGSVAATELGASNASLAAAGSWTLPSDKKNLGMVAINHLI